MISYLKSIYHQLYINMYMLSQYVNIILTLVDIKKKCKYNYI